MMTVHENGDALPGPVRRALDALRIPKDQIDLKAAEAAYNDLRQQALDQGNHDLAAAFGDAYGLVVAYHYQRSRPARTTLPPHPKATRPDHDPLPVPVRGDRHEATSVVPGPLPLQAELVDAAEEMKEKSASRAQRCTEATDWGWPAAWPVRGFRKWVRRGNTADEARIWSAGGWTPREIGSLLSGPDHLPSPPRGEATTWRELGADANQALQLQALGVQSDDISCCGVDRLEVADWILENEDPAERLSWLRSGVGPIFAQLAADSGLAPTDANVPGDLACLVMLVVHVGLAALPGSERAGNAYPGEWSEVEGYLTRLSQTFRPLMTANIHRGCTVEVSRVDQGLLLKDAQGAVSRLHSREVAAVPQILAALGADEFTSAGWTAADIATLMAPWLDSWLVDDVEWERGDFAPRPAWEDFPTDCVLAENSWELVGGSGSPGGSHDSGTETLVRIGPRYGVYCSDPGEWSAISAVDDEAAVAEFVRQFTSPDTEGSIQRPVIFDLKKPY